MHKLSLLSLGIRTLPQQAALYTLWQNKRLGAMDLRHLKLFLAVADTGSFSKAGATCSVAQPVLSRCVRELEETLGVVLFIRTGRGAVLTPAGLRFREHAKDILDRVNSALSEFVGLQTNPIGEVILGVPPTVGALLIVPLVRRFKLEFPRGSLKISEVFSGAVAEWLSIGRLDVAVLYNPPKSSTLVVDDLIEEQLYLVGSNAHGEVDLPNPVPTALLGDLPLVLPSRPHGLRLLVERSLAEVKSQLGTIVEVDSLQAMVALVEAGIGFTVLPYASVKGEMQAGRLKCWPIHEPTIARRLVVATSTARPLTGMARTMVSMVRQEVSRLVAEGYWEMTLPEATDQGLPLKAKNQGLVVVS
ncbi:LysR family transcriptional regulator [Lichenicoccus sp.]|uniref:LysR family transcriptional regulator n=1 Tax=Lichenicoccus sp. TaxID=2781899 RepID=UPI003D0B7AA0